MNLVFPSTFRRGPAIALLAASLVLVLCVAVLLASVASATMVAGVPGGDGPLLAPFRWGSIAHDLA